MDFTGKKVLVCGLGLSGIASARKLRDLGADVTACDIKPQDKINGLDELDGVRLYLTKNPDAIVSEQELIVISPGIPTDLPFVETAKACGIPVWSEIELGYRLCPCPIIAITGTNGKTTTTSLTGEIMGLHNQGTRVVGNIGVSFVGALSRLTPRDVAVAEISSFQLESISEFRPGIAAVLNITPDHLNRHKTLENYVNIKRRIFMNQQPEDFAVLNADDSVCVEMSREIKSRPVFFSRSRVLDEGVFVEDGYITYRLSGECERLIRVDDLIIPGTHNLENALAASAIAICAGVPAGTVRQGLLRFRGVEHRIELVGEVNGVEFYNDSKATNPEAAIKAIEAMNRPIVLIGGGYDKNSDFSDWVRAFDGRVKSLVLIGEVADKIIECCTAYNFMSYDKANSLRSAVELGFAKAAPGDCVLLSPACASYDMFDNYEQRGRMFKQFVKEL